MAILALSLASLLMSVIEMKEKDGGMWLFFSIIMASVGFPLANVDDAVMTSTGRIWSPRVLNCLSVMSSSKDPR